MIDVLLTDAHQGRDNRHLKNTDILIGALQTYTYSDKLHGVVIVTYAPSASTPCSPLQQLVIWKWFLVFRWNS